MTRIRRPLFPKPPQKFIDAPPFPGGLKAAVSFALGALITSYVQNKIWFMIFRKTAYTNLTGKKKGGSVYAVYLFISKPAGL